MRTAPLLVGLVVLAGSCAPGIAAVTCDVDADCGSRACVGGICVDGPAPDPDAGQPQADAGPTPEDAGAPPPIDDAGPPPPVDAGPVVEAIPGYGFRLPLRLTTAVTAPLFDFPIPFTVSSTDVGARAEIAVAPAVRFTAGDGTTLLAHELELDEGGARVFWVRVPVLEATTTIYVYWDNFGGNEVAPVDSFPSALFAGVWHLSEATAGYPDSSGNFNTMRTVLLSERPANVAGAVGPAVSFNNATPTPLTTLADALTFPAGSFSYTLWVRPDVNVGDFDMPLYQGGEPEVPGFDIELGAGAWNAGYSAGGGDARYPEFTQAGTLNELHHLAVVVDRDADLMSTYLDGAATATATLDLAEVAATGPLTLGRGEAFPYSGLLDEVRIYNGVITPEWIRAEFSIVDDPASIAIGPRESL